ncbi:MAG: apolipoprotein N-acyltransferase [Acidobacteriaceae bacterium]
MDDRLHTMRAGSKLGWVLAAESGILLVLPFPVAGPLPHWRAELAWIAFVPLFIALLVPKAGGFGWPRVWRNTLLGYFCGILWYGGTCYWIESTMRLYGNFSPFMANILLLLFCLYLGLYFALFGFLVSLGQRATGSTAWTLLATPFLWTAVELARARITSFPWNQLGDSQIDNLLLTHLARWTGSYGIGFVLVAVNCAIASFFLLRGWRARLIPAILGIAVAVGLSRGYALHVPSEPTHATAMLVQPNLDVSGGNDWMGDVFDLHMQRLAALSEDTCNPHFLGLPTRGVPEVTPDCTPRSVGKLVSNLIVWPESPAPFEDGDPHFRHWISALAEDAHAPMIVGDIAVEREAGSRGSGVFNSAAFVARDGTFVGRYDKMHLVPFGEYTPFPQLLSFAGSLTDQVGHMTPGKHRVVFAAEGHRYGVFICYESIFADEVRQFVKLGADVLVNISDDGWYGDTSAPWQHLNMTRMRAIENDRWVLVATNNGVTAVINPRGQVVQSAPRHVETSLLAHFNYRTDETFYTHYGDLFAWLCAIIAIVLAVDGAVQNHYRRA